MTLASDKTEARERWRGWWAPRHAWVLLPLLLLVGTGLRGLDFGLHWDERAWQIGPVKHMVQSRTLLPGYYNYPSFDYWLNLAVLTPDAVAGKIAGEGVQQHLLRVLDSPAFLLRLRAVYLLLSSLSLLWVYWLVLGQRGSRWEAFLAASLLACSWEVAYHLRWVASDGMLMLFASLTVFLALKALRTRRERWLLAAAAAAGFGFATKYPGGLLLAPVALAGFFGAAGCSRGEKAMRLVKAAAIFALVFLVVTPATVLQPAEILRAVLYEIRHYATGHGGHTIGRGLEHAGQMLAYFSTVLFSPHRAVALFIFALAVFGLVSIVARGWREGAVLLAFPLCYLLYFSTQGTMVVRNLLAVVPFLAIAAARGAGVVGEFLARPRNRPRAQARGATWSRAAWAGLLCAVLCVNALSVIVNAESIVARHSDRFVREAAEYIRTHGQTKFLLSPRVEHEVAALAVQPLDNVTVLPAEADIVVLYAREGMKRWHDWPANRPRLTQACFGPGEVNFNIYPNWWGDDRIVAISRPRAEEMRLLIAGISEEAEPPPEPAPLRPAAEKDAASLTSISPDALPRSWALPAADPRALVLPAEVENVLGPLERGPTSGGWELDGKACTYLARDGLVVSIALISTAAFDLQRRDLGSTPVPGIGAYAYAVRSGPLSGPRLFARSQASAVVIHLSGHSRSAEQLIASAGQLATLALNRLDAEAEQRVQ